jgi:hypothetical protein
MVLCGEDACFFHDTRILKRRDCVVQDINNQRTLVIPPLVELLGIARAHANQHLSREGNILRKSVVNAICSHCYQHVELAPKQTLVSTSQNQGPQFSNKATLHQPDRDE